MPDEGRAVAVTIQVGAGADASDAESESVAQLLVDELRDLPLEAIERVPVGRVPHGGKPIEPVTLGVIAVAVLPAVLPKLIEFVQSWAMRGDSHTVKMKVGAGDRTVEVEFPPAAMTPSQVKQLAEKLMQTADRSDDG